MIALDLHISTFLIVYFIIVLLFFLCQIKRKHKFHPYYTIIILYFLLLFKVTICPITYVRAEYRDILNQENVLALSIQLIPLKTFFDTIRSGTWGLQLLGNLILLSPLPILFSIKGNKICSSKKIFALAISISMSIEILQFLINVIGHFPTHIVDIDDIILNVLGIEIGILISKFMQRCGLLNKLNNMLIVNNS